MASRTSSIARSTSERSGHLFVRKVQGPRKLQKFGHHVGQRARLLDDALRVSAYVALGFAANHLRVAGDRGQRVLEFVRNAGGKLAQRGQALLHLHLVLQRGQFGQIAQQAQRSGNPLGRVPRIGEIVTPSCRSSPLGRGVLDLLAAERAPFRQAIRPAASPAAIRCPALRCSADRKGHAHPRAASAAGLALVIRPAELISSSPAGMLRVTASLSLSVCCGALAIAALQRRQFLFLLAEFLNHGLHRGGHESGGIIDGRLGQRRFRRVLLGSRPRESRAECRKKTSAAAARMNSTSMSRCGHPAEAQRRPLRVTATSRQ